MDEYHISRAENGFVLRYEDQKVRDSNRNEGSKWKDPMVTRVYETDAALIQDLASLMPKMNNSKKDESGEYKSAFNEAASK